MPQSKRHNLNKQIAMQLLVQELFLIITLEYLWMETVARTRSYLYLVPTQCNAKIEILKW